MDADYGSNDSIKITMADYLSSLLGKTLRVRIEDGRMFIGSFSCVDKVRRQAARMQCEELKGSKDCNIILDGANEHRPPTPEQQEESRTAPFRVPLLVLTGRYVGLIVVPGGLITRIEVERFDPRGIA